MCILFSLIEFNEKLTSHLDGRLLLTYVIMLFISVTAAYFIIEWIINKKYTPDLKRNWWFILYRDTILTFLLFVATQCIIKILFNSTNTELKDKSKYLFPKFLWWFLFAFWILCSIAVVLKILYVMFRSEDMKKTPSEDNEIKVTASTKFFK